MCDSLAQSQLGRRGNDPQSVTAAILFSVSWPLPNLAKDCQKLRESADVEDCLKSADTQKKEQGSHQVFPTFYTLVAVWSPPFVSFHASTDCLPLRDNGIQHPSLWRQGYLRTNNSQIKRILNKAQLPHLSRGIASNSCFSPEWNQPAGVTSVTCRRTENDWWAASGTEVFFVNHS